MASSPVIKNNTQVFFLAATNSKTNLTTNSIVIQSSFPTPLGYVFDDFARDHNSWCYALEELHEPHTSCLNRLKKRPVKEFARKLIHCREALRWY
ncbi:hypothetical protein CEXT_410641 [Caerostris extrusa]|uniref:Uncharacterized protein n=1 Tax=Caerostris extrusa TaxID=172846 RepID=A0AAV4P4R3_CAEEX|nr:hypothetical protein CEXT_410641 [Caerostris extrusa]